MKGEFTIHVLSDASGETAAQVAQAALAQFSEDTAHLERHQRIRSTTHVTELVRSFDPTRSLIAFTLALPVFREAVLKESATYRIPVVDLLGPLINQIATLSAHRPFEEAGRLHQLDEAYFRRIDAIHFAIHHDDGAAVDRIVQADVVLLGVSRVSKTPSCMYLAQRYGLKAANIPLVLGIEPPSTLYQVPSEKIVGLTVDPHVLVSLRAARARLMGMGDSTHYTELEAIRAEVNHAQQVFRAIGCHVIDVSSKAIEETSSEIALYLESGIP